MKQQANGLNKFPKGFLAENLGKVHD